MKQSYYVNAIWDPEASVWFSESDIPGLVIEAETLAEFEAIMFDLAPEMLATNLGLHNQSVPFRFSAQSERHLAVA